MDEDFLKFGDEIMVTGYIIVALVALMLLTAGA